MNPFLPNIGERGQREIQKFIRQGKFEWTDHGVRIPAMGISFGLWHTLSINGEVIEKAPNLVPYEGQTYYQQVGLLGGAQVSTWYLVPYANATDPTLTWTAANFNSNASEVTNYTASTRPAWQPDSNVTQGLVVTQTRSTITASTGGIAAINGIGLLSDSVKGSITGTLVSAARYANTVVLPEGQSYDLGFQSDLDDESEVAP